MGIKKLHIDVFNQEKMLKRHKVYNLSFCTCILTKLNAHHKDGTGVMNDSAVLLCNFSSCSAVPPHSVQSRCTHPTGGQLRCPCKSLCIHARIVPRVLHFSAVSLPVATPLYTIYICPTLSFG